MEQKKMLVTVVVVTLPLLGGCIGQSDSPANLQLTVNEENKQISGSGRLGEERINISLQVREASNARVYELRAVLLEGLGHACDFQLSHANEGKSISKGDTLFVSFLYLGENLTRHDVKVGIYNAVTDAELFVIGPFSWSSTPPPPETSG